MATNEAQTSVLAFTRPTTDLAHLHESLERALERMAAAGLDCIAIVDGDELVGLAERSAIEQTLATAERTRGEPALRDLPRSATWHCFEDTEADVALATMRAHGVEHLAVLDHDERLLGTVAAADLERRVDVTRGTAPVPQAEGVVHAAEEQPSLRVYEERPRLARR